MRIGIITGSRRYLPSEESGESPAFKEIAQKLCFKISSHCEAALEERVSTRFGEAYLVEAEYPDHTFIFVSRHGEKARQMPIDFNYRANVWALKEKGVDFAIIFATVGVINPAFSLGKPFLFHDIYFIENRLPDGSLCTFYMDPQVKPRYQYIISSPFSQSLRKMLLSALSGAEFITYPSGVYGFVQGPRYNTLSEVKSLQNMGIIAVSQSAGPEVILAGEVGLPVAMVGFGTSYPAGVVAEATPKEEVTVNYQNSFDCFAGLLKEVFVSKNLGTVTFDNGYLLPVD